MTGFILKDQDLLQWKKLLNNMEKKRSPKDIFVLIVLIISGLYLINPTMGLLEIIPDNLPIIGNLDEGVATTLLLSSLSYFGYNFTDIFKRKK